MIYYELLEDGTIGRSTNNEKIAESNGYFNENQIVESEEDIVDGYDGKRYLKGQEPSKPQELIKKETSQKQIIKLTQQLEETDYIANKLAEAVSKYISTGDNTDVLLLREKYALELANRETWRKEIDKLQQELKLLDK